MKTHRINKFDKNITSIHPGEFYVSDKDEMIGTLLGSCIAVCFHDKENNISGMNHFMLPGRISSTSLHEDRNAKYGMQAIFELLENMYRCGAVRKNIEARIFGGGSVVAVENFSHQVPEDNIKVARVVLEMEDIPIISQDVGGKFTRKLIMDVLTGKIYLKKTINKAEDKVI